MNLFDTHLLRDGRLLGVVLAGTTLIGPAQAADAADPTGVWLVQDAVARVRIEKCGPQRVDLCGYTVWLLKPLDDQGQPRRDTQNPDPSRKGQPILGHQNLMGL